MARCSLASLLLAFVPALAAAQRFPAESTTILAPLAGQLAAKARWQRLSAARFSPNLGLTAIHEGELRIVFGDAIAVRTGAPISLTRDDVQGEISLTAFPDGDAVDAYVAAHPSAAAAPRWRRQAPPVTYRLDGLRLASVVRVHDGSAAQPLLNTGLFKAPLAAFSNALPGADSGFFTIYGRSVPMRCSGGETPSCGEGFTCEPRLGQLGGTAFEDGAPCPIGTPLCGAVAEGGLCVDPTSPLYDAGNPAGLARAVVWKHAVGNADRMLPERYYARPWFTHKFMNLCARTVSDFDSARAGGRGNDYRPADGSRPGAAKLLLWGRPGYIGTGADGRDLRLYFAVVDMPRYSASADFAWEPRYFTGVSASGVPQFTADPGEARALDLGGAPLPEHERWDVVNQMSISWVAPLGAWVMLYGGGTNETLAQVLTYGEGGLVEPDPEGAIQIRFAPAPWGPWSAPEPLLNAGSPLPVTEAPREASQYGPGGILRHPLCTAPECAPEEPTIHAGDYGFLYGANVIDAWTEAVDSGAALYWNVSTWHPYQVVLIKSVGFAASDGDDRPTVPDVEHGGLNAGAAASLPEPGAGAAADEGSEAGPEVGERAAAGRSTAGGAHAETAAGHHDAGGGCRAAAGAAAHTRFAAIYALLVLQLRRRRRTGRSAGSNQTARTGTESSHAWIAVVTIEAVAPDRQCSVGGPSGISTSTISPCVCTTSRGTAARSSPSIARFSASTSPRRQR